MNGNLPHEFLELHCARSEKDVFAAVVLVVYILAIYRHEVMGERYAVYYERSRQVVGVWRHDIAEYL